MANFARQPCRVIASNCQQQKVLCCLSSHLLHQTGPNSAAARAFIAQIPFPRNETTSLLSESAWMEDNITETCMKCREGRETLRAVRVLDAFPRPFFLRPRPGLINEQSSHSSARPVHRSLAPKSQRTCAIVPAILNSDMGQCFQRND